MGLLSGKNQTIFFPLTLGTAAIEGILFFKFQQTLLLISANIIFTVMVNFQKEI
ncbi:hypothetical protein BPTFM16_02891 [Altererythrobacter insulae]|nr:hypothetical protein BPTFM16_02891 [Altererythrobacter insulae]